MTDNFPPAPVLNHAEPIPGEGPAPSGLVIVFCWAIILAIVGLEVASNIDRSKSAANAPADNFTMAAIGKYIVGARHALDSSADKSGQGDATALLVADMEAVAKSPADQLRLAIISKEVESAAMADKRLESLNKSKDLTPAVKGDLDILNTIYRSGPAAISDSQRKLLIDDEGWFAQVALSFGLPDSTPIRSEMLAQAKRACIFYTGAGFAGGFALFIGAGLIILAIVLAATGRLPLWFRRPKFDSVFLEAFALYLAGFVVLSLVLHAIIHSPGLGWSLVLTIMLPIALLWPVVRGKPWAQTRIEFGWHCGKGIFREIGCGLIGYLAALPLLAVMLLITLQLIRLSGTNPSHPVVSYLNGGPSEIVLIYFIACVWAPVFEESMFRGALFNHLRARHGWWISAGVVGLLFASVHPQGWTTIPVLGGIGMVLCALREWRGSLIASMSAHALSNGMVITLALLTSR
jgi:membrane protease YdiL (CAAX protease family)